MMDKLVAKKNLINFIAAISTLVAFAGSFAALTFWAFFAPYVVVTFLGFTILTILYFINSKKTFREYREAIIFGIALLNSAYLFFFGNVFFDAIANLGNSANGLEVFKNIVVILTQGAFLVCVIVVLILEITYEIIRNLKLNKEDSIDFNDKISRKYIITNKALVYTAIGFIAFAFISSLIVFWGNNGLLYCLFIIFAAFVAMLLFDASSQVNKNAIAYLIILSILLIIYYCLFGVIGFVDGILPIKGSSSALFMVSWIMTAIILPAVIIFGIIMLIKKERANRQGLNRLF